MLSLALLTVVGLAVGCEGAENVLGGCPTVPAQQRFNMSQFAGTWYIQDVFDRRVHCMKWEISPLPGDVWQLEETKKSGLSRIYNGKIYPDEAGTGQLLVSWSANVGGKYPLTVFNTDYDNFAGIFMCQKLWFTSRWNGMIMSREPNMKRGKRQELKGSLAAYAIPMGYFHRVTHLQCGVAPPPLDTLGPNGRPGGEQDLFVEQFGGERQVQRPR